jgi:hypothetical protein
MQTNNVLIDYQSLELSRKYFMIDIKTKKKFSFFKESRNLFKNSLFYLHDIDTYNHLYLFLQFFPNLFLSYDRLNKSRFEFEK